MNSFMVEIIEVMVNVVVVIIMAARSTIQDKAAASRTSFSHEGDVVGPTGTVYAVEFPHQNMIESSNLNRQFLFQKKHVKRPKAILAKETAINFNPSVKIKVFQANISIPEYSTVNFYNLTARRNKLCVASDVPTIKSDPDRDAVWAKNYLFGFEELRKCKSIRQLQNQNSRNKRNQEDWIIKINQSKHLVVQTNQTSKSTNELKYQQVLDLLDSLNLFCSSLMKLGEQMKSSSDNEPLTWDIHNDNASDLVTAAENLRAHLFGIPLRTRFEVKGVIVFSIHCSYKIFDLQHFLAYLDA
ncbi:uncharacterized protein MELLADRAFT_102204 [Melampsora larici-populina 98AG31]|uniref:THIF-type NAD/FAD binding fold domain-containing protein n=1 Tax=Melampsora larici-populina (strain 98AG31 / pathotype 3-4-7) TaxID=747676 RepID=F4R7I8_MELLP|nr:uncharacterized protein MELLADRAFT_102204 [Melampsora larici-populina 98AG31]EGG11779.1 hypothetical protein MELLADRAFT_102204 [Melampsora larici-populina 98AG31]